MLQETPLLYGVLFALHTNNKHLTVPITIEDQVCFKQVFFN